MPNGLRPVPPLVLPTRNMTPHSNRKSVFGGDSESKRIAAAAALGSKRGALKMFMTHVSPVSLVSPNYEVGAIVNKF